jgi:hypothetical protein
MFKRKEITTTLHCSKDYNIKKIITNFYDDYNNKSMKDYILNYKQLLNNFSLLFLKEPQVNIINNYIYKLSNLFNYINRINYDSNKDTIDKCLLEILPDIVRYSRIICYIIYKKVNTFLNKDKTKIKLIYDILTYNFIIQSCITNEKNKVNIKSADEVYITSSKKNFIKTYFEQFPVNFDDTNNILKYLNAIDFQKHIELLKPELEQLDVYTYEYDSYSYVNNNMEKIITYIKDNLFMDLYLSIKILFPNIESEYVYKKIEELLSNLETYEKDETIKEKLILNLIWYYNLILNISLLLYYNEKYSDILTIIEYNNIFYVILYYLINNTESKIQFLLKRNRETVLNKLTKIDFDKYIFNINVRLQANIILLESNLKNEGRNTENLTEDIAKIKIKNDIVKKLHNQLKYNYIQQEEITNIITAIRSPKSMVESKVKVSKDSANI